MAKNSKAPTTKVNPINAGLGIGGLKGYNPQQGTQTVNKESQTYQVTRNDGTTVNKSYNELSPKEKKAVATTGVVQGGKTDIENQYRVVSGSVGTAPTKELINGLATLTSIPMTAAMGAKGGPIGLIISSGLATLNFINTGAKAAENERKYAEAMREFNEKAAKNSTIAGSWEKDDDGNMVFMPDYSKVGKDINVSASGARIADLFDLDGKKEPDVYFTDDGVLHIDVNEAFANTEEYQRIVDSVSADYAGLTKDTADVEQYLRDIKQRVGSAFDQYRFAVNRVAGYRNRLPEADVSTILDAASGEIGAVLSDSDKKDWPVKVYRDGEIIESNAQDVLDHVYNMGDKYKRNDYIEELADLLNDDSLSDDEKAYVLAEYNLLFSASDADVKEGDDERKKYAGMLDQDWAVTFFKSSGLISGADALVDGVAGFVSQGRVDDVLLANQNYLEPDEVAKNFGSIAGTAFDIYVTRKIMQGLEYKVVRPALGSISSSAGRALIASGSEKLGKIGEKLLKGVSITDITNRAGDVVGYKSVLNLDAIKNACLNNVIMAFGSETGGLSIRLLAKGAGDFVAYSLGEVGINFAADALFDATKLGTAVLAGEIKSDEEAAQYINNELGQDLVMDLLLQYGPQGMLDLHTTADAIRLQHIEPYTQKVVDARTKYGDALNAVDAAKATKTSAKKMKQLNNDVVVAKNELTKAETEYGDAMTKWGASRSQRLGAKVAGVEARLTEHAMYRKFQEAVLDENAAGTALVRAAYAASGGDVDLFNKLMNMASNNLRTLTRMTANELMSDKWAKGTGDAFNAFKQKYSDLANRKGDLSEDDINYIKAKNEIIRYTEAAEGDKDKIAETERNYAKYIDAVSPERAAELDELMDTMRDVVNKTNESAVNAGIETEENIQTKRSATGFQEQGYIPMYLKRKNKTGRYVIGQERNLDHTWDRGEFWNIDNLENPVLNTLTYVNYTARNIAVNERNKALIAASEIPGMSTYRTDVDNEIIRTEDGHIYKHSDIVEHMSAKIDARLNKIEKVKTDAPTETEFSDEKNKIVYGKEEGSHEDLVDEFEVSSGLDKLQQEHSELVKQQQELKEKQDEALRAGAQQKNYLRRFDKGATPENAYIKRQAPTLDTTFTTIYRFFNGEDGGALIDNVLESERGQEAFRDILTAVGGDKDAAFDEIVSRINPIINDRGIRKLIREDGIEGASEAIERRADFIFTAEQREALFEELQKEWPGKITNERNKWTRWYRSVQPLIRNLGIESYTYFNESPDEVAGGQARGLYSPGIIEGEASLDESGRYYWETESPQRIEISLAAFDNLPQMKSTIVHEASHAAWSMAANRVPIARDIFRMLGVKGKVTEELAASRDFSELVAYMTQKKFISEFSAKGRKDAEKIFLDDEIVQHHLNNILDKVASGTKKMNGRQKVSFKERFIDMIMDATLFIKGKLTGVPSLRNVGTFTDFYNGLISGRFASDMRVDRTGSRWVKTGIYVGPNGGESMTGDMFINWSEIPPDADQMATDMAELQNKISANEDAQAEAKKTLRAEFEARVNALKDYYNDTYGKFGYTTNVRISWTKVDALVEAGDVNGLATYLEDIKDRASLGRPTDQALTDAEFDKQVTGLEIEIKRSINKNFPGLNKEQKRDIYARVLGEFRRKAAEAGDITAEQVANETFARNVGYPITYYENGEEKTAYIEGPLAKPVYEMVTRSENVTDRNFIQKVFEGAAKLKRYSTTAIDATRALPNLLRDTLRGDIMSGGTDYAGARKIFTEILDAENLTVEQKAKAMESIELAIRVAQGETLNAAVENRTENGLREMVRDTRQEGKNAVSRIVWDVAHGHIGHALETPMNVAEMFTRRRMAQSAYVREFKNAKYTSSSFEERLNRAYNAGVNAGMENTTNFSRRGSAVGAIARYVPYFQQNFSNIESANNAFLKDPAGVAARAAMFQYAYIMMLAETLKKEETRRAYYNLSDYDRKNNIVFSLDGNTLVTIPVDESLVSLITPWRRTIETLNGVDPATFAGIFTDTLLDLSPIDLDGFTEGDGLNMRRGLEKIASEMAPSLATGLIQTITGYNLYYGSDNAVTDTKLAEYGGTAKSAGDYTTASANSKILRAIADATGIPQWMLQQTVANFSGNVGQYVLNSLDKLAGAAKDEQGGKDFVEAVFKSMSGSDSTNVKSQFYNGINLLKKDREKVVNKLQALNDQIAVATGAELADLKKEYQQVKDDYATKVSKFVDQYLSMYEITGGLSKSQASQVYYLFNLYDDDTVYQSGSVGEYYQNLARQQAYNEADSWAAPILDKYYDQTQNVYKDSSGVWHYSSPYGEQAYYNTIYGQGMKHQVGLRNLIEGATDNLKKARSNAYDARSAAMDAKDYDLYDQIGADFDAQVVEAISPYIREYGADEVLNNSSVLDYLEEWFFVPSSYMKTNKGRYVPALAHNASKQRAFVRSYIKSLYGVSTEYNKNESRSLLNPEVFPNE